MRAVALIFHSQDASGSALPNPRQECRGHGCKPRFALSPLTHFLAGTLFEHDKILTNLLKFLAY